MIGCGQRKRGEETLSTLSENLDLIATSLKEHERLKQILGNTKAKIQSGKDVRLDTMDRVWLDMNAGASTGDPIRDTVVLIRHQDDQEMYERLSKMMAPFATHRGEFAACFDWFNHTRKLLVGIICGEAPSYKPNSYRIQMPMSPAIVFETEWQWGFNNLKKADWGIELGPEANPRCWELEKWVESSARDLYVGDAAVWTAISTLKLKCDPMAAFTRVASALGRPLASAEVLKDIVLQYREDTRLRIERLDVMVGLVSSVQKTAEHLELKAEIPQDTEQLKKLVQSLRETLTLLDTPDPSLAT